MSDDSSAVPRIAELLGPVLAPIPARSLPGFLCLLERAAAGRYREWADSSSEEQREGLLACAAREDEIADRIEAVLPIDPADRDSAEALLPEATKLYAEVFDALSLEEQFRRQASAEREGAAAWRGFAAQHGDDALTPTFEACAKLEEQSAAHLESLLQKIV